MQHKINRWSVYTFLIITSLVGGVIGWATYQNTILVKGILGATTILLILLYGVVMKQDGSIEAILSRPNQLYTVIKGLAISIVFFWSFMSLFEMLVLALWMFR